MNAEVAAELRRVVEAVVRLGDRVETLARLIDALVVERKRPARRTKRKAA